MFADVLPSPQSIIPSYVPSIKYGNIILSDGVVVLQTEINGGKGVGVGDGVYVGVGVFVGVNVGEGRSTPVKSQGQTFVIKVECPLPLSFTTP